jgi:Gluconate 2-dehydrogenase subunit 3
MAGQSIERREVLRILAMVAGAAQFSGFSKRAFACGHVGNAAMQTKPASYQALFFGPLEYRLVERLADIIIPSDRTPGAREAGVAEFIDFMTANDPSAQYKFRAARGDVGSCAREGGPWMGGLPITQAVGSSVAEPVSSGTNGRGRRLVSGSGFQPSRRRALRTAVSLRPSRPAIHRLLLSLTLRRRMVRSRSGISAGRGERVGGRPCGLASALSPPACRHCW